MGARPALTACETAELRVTASDPNGDSLSYHWSISSGPDGAAVDESANPSHFTPGGVGSYELQVSVEDDLGGRAVLSFPIHVSPCERRVFLTADSVTPDFGGYAGADAICQAAADSAGLGGSWMAWLSDSENSPDARFNKSDSDYVLLDGTVIANGWADLTDGSLDSSIRVDEYGVALGNHEAWTNTSPGGANLGGSPCNDFTSASGDAPYALRGLAHSSDARWSTACYQFCDRTDDHLYCFEQ